MDFSAIYKYTMKATMNIYIMVVVCIAIKSGKLDISVIN